MKEYILEWDREGTVNLLITSDPQELVRCKDCRFREECNQKMAYDPDWFCADGIRRKD